MEMNHILVVEDDKEIREGVKIYLQSQGYEVFLAADGIEGLEVMEKEDIHLAIVDIMMPRMDGIRMTMKLREKYDFPVIMLSAKSEEVDKIMGLNIGADDYISKPFSMMEMVARVKALIRRSEYKHEEKDYTINNLYVCPIKHLVKVDDREVVLTLKEYEMLCLLLKNRGIVLSREQLLNKIWGYSFDGESRTVDVHVRTLRQKLGTAGDVIKTIRGVGYKISA